MQAQWGIDLYGDLGLHQYLQKFGPAYHVLLVQTACSLVEVVAACWRPIPAGFSGGSLRVLLATHYLQPASAKFLVDWSAARTALWSRIAHYAAAGRFNYGLQHALPLDLHTPLLRLLTSRRALALAV